MATPRPEAPAAITASNMSTSAQDGRLLSGSEEPPPAGTLAGTTAWPGKTLPLAVDPGAVAPGTVPGAAALVFAFGLGARAGAALPVLEPAVPEDAPVPEEVLAPVVPAAGPLLAPAAGPLVVGAPGAVQPLPIQSS